MTPHRQQWLAGWAIQAAFGITGALITSRSLVGRFIYAALYLGFIFLLTRVSKREQKKSDRRRMETDEYSS